MAKLFLEFERLKDIQTGLGQVCYHLGQQFSTLLPKRIKPTLFLPKKKFDIFHHANFSYVDTQKGLMKTLRAFKPYDLWHCLHQDSKYLPKNPKTKLIYTIHDLNFLFEKDLKQRQQERLLKLQKRISRADVITVISNYTKKLVLEYLKTNDKPIHVIHNGVEIDHALSPVKPKAQDLEREFLLTISAISPKKNTMALIEALPFLPSYQLVLAGNADDHAYVDQVMQRAKTLNVFDRVQFLGKVTEAEKYWLYAHCQAFVFPSLLEGFGLPVIEAMHFGKPVFLSRCMSLPEVGGFDAYYWEDFDPKLMADRLQAGLSDFEKEPEKRDRVRAWAQSFSWEKAAKRYIDVYESLI